jgi:VanZ family protein
MKKIYSWFPSIIIMVVIYCFSAIPGNEMPVLWDWDIILKKTSHILGFGLLACSYWYAFKWERKRILFVFFLAVLFALGDEYHQSFVPGRNSSLVDALGFDSFGAFAALTGVWFFKNRKER